MLTLIQREARLSDFLHGAFPTHRIAPGVVPFPLEPPSPGSAPEIRLVCESVSAEGMLRWKIQIIPTAGQTEDSLRVGENGILATAEKLREAIRDSVYASSGGAIRRGDAGAACWEEILQEPFAAAEAVPQSLFAFSDDVALLPTDGVDAGVSNFGEVELFDGAQVGVIVMLHNSIEGQYLGAILELDPFRTEWPTRAALTGAIKFRNLTAGISAGEPADEQEQFEPGKSELLSETLDGRRLRREAALPSTSLILRFPALAASEVREWSEYLRAHADRPCFLLARTDRSIVEASVTRVICNAASRSGAGALEIQLDARGLVSFSAFAEELP